MVMPSILTLAIGAAVLVVLSALLRYLDNDAFEQARRQARERQSQRSLTASTPRKAA